LAITGSKGKSSLVKVCCEALETAGVSAVTAGNYGVPLSARVLEKNSGWAVTEVSSFQLEFVEAFRPDVAVLLNLQADHLDRHASEAEYRACKFRMFQNMRDGDTALLPEGLPEFEALKESLVARGASCESFGDNENAKWRYEQRSTGIPACVLRNSQARMPVLRYSLRGSWFDNEILGLAAAAGAGALAACGLEREAVEKGFREFEPLQHRMQPVAEEGGVRWVDDSKATSFAAVCAALRMTAGPVRLIAGGRAKEHDASFVKELLARWGKKVYLIGECSEFLSQSWAGAAACEKCGDMANAVRRASDEASAGETVLLSPGCASFDQFGSYHERGEVFAKLAREAAERRKSQQGSTKEG